MVERSPLNRTVLVYDQNPLLEGETTLEEKEIVLTPEGLKRMEEELHRLRTISRKEVTNRIRDSKQFGELTENAEYEEAKTEQAFVEGRIEELRNVLNHALVLKDEDIQTDHVGIGCTVTLKDLSSGDEFDYQVVGPLEADPLEDKISNESPVGEALMNHRIGDKIHVRVPEGIGTYEIVNISKS